MIELKASVRGITGRKTKELRKENIIPAVVCGHGLKSLSIQVASLDFKKSFEQAGESSLIDLKIEGQDDRKVLIHEIQYHPLTDKVEHIDFYQVKEGEKIEVEVDLEFVGVSRAVKDLNGILIHELEKVEVECLPKDLIRSIEVDLSQLAEINDIIRVGDLKVSENIKILSDPENSVVAVKAPSSKEEDVPQEKEAEDVVSDEVNKKGEKDQIEESASPNKNK